MNTFTRYCKVIRFSIIITFFNNYQLDSTLLYLPLKALHYTKSCRENYVAKIMSRKALHSVLLHKSEVTYRDTGVSKKRTRELDESERADKEK